MYMEKLIELFDKIGLSQEYIKQYHVMREALDNEREKDVFVADKIEQIESSLKYLSSNEVREIMEAQMDRVVSIINPDAEKHKKALDTIEKYSFKLIEKLKEFS